MEMHEKLFKDVYVYVCVCACACRQLTKGVKWVITKSSYLLFVRLATSITIAHFIVIVVGAVV